MAKYKRPSIRGRGAAIFLPATAAHSDVRLSAQSTSKTTKATFHLPVELLEALDIHWLDLRRKRRITKSEIVRCAVESYLVRHASTGQPDGTTTEHPDAVT